jgi:uncharacterized protein (DUF433 family)
MAANQQGKLADLEAFRSGEAYTLAEAARLAKMSPQNVRRWMHGYQPPGHPVEPVFNGKERDSRTPAVSFLELVELAIAGEFLRGTPGMKPASLARVRAAHRYLCDQLGVEFPFASVRLQTEGGRILHDFGERQPKGGSLVVSAGGQWVLPEPIQEELDALRYRDGLAAEWFPFGSSVPIRINPLIAAGRPTVAGTGVRVETLRERAAAGEPIECLSEDYGIEPSTIEQILPYAA